MLRFSFLFLVCLSIASGLTHLDKSAAWRNALGSTPKTADGFLAPLEDFADDDAAYAALSLMQDGVELSKAGQHAILLADQQGGRDWVPSAAWPFEEPFLHAEF